MLADKIETIKIFGVKVSKLTYQEFLQCIKENINNTEKGITIGYANADTLNKAYCNKSLKDIFNSFDLIHPDGTGVFLASKFLYGNNGLEERISGSDFYSILIDESIKNNWKYFFFGHSNEVLDKIKESHPLLKISGLHEGYKYNNSEVIYYINKSNSDIIIVGLSSPKQEKWIFDNKGKIDFKVMLTVGDGIKVFAGDKIRGPVFLRRIGLEWVVRYITSPVSNFKKYILGVPLFIFRIFREKPKLN